MALKGTTGTSMTIEKRPGAKKKNYNAPPPASDVKITRADGTVEWVESKKKYVKNYGEVKFSGE